MIPGQLFPGRRLEENILIYQRDVGGEILRSFPLNEGHTFGMMAVVQAG